MKDLNDYADRLLGVPYKYQGRGLDGLCCWGLVLLAYRFLGWDLPDLVKQIQDEEGTREVLDRALVAYRSHFDEIQPKDASVGDVVLFFDARQQTNHAAVVVSATHCLHSGERTGVIRTKLVQVLRRPDTRVYRYTGKRG